MTRSRAALLACAVSALGLLAGCALPSADAATSAGGVGSVSCDPSGAVTGWTAEQVSNARAIAQVALSRGLGPEGVLIGVTTAITEATLINVAHGDAMGPSSIGLFQQMPPWGPLEVRTDPAGSAGLFYDALVKVPNWKTIPVPQAAQAVEQSEFADGSNYAGNLDAAKTLTAEITATCGTGPGSATGVQQNASQDPSTFGWIRAANQVPFSWKGRTFGSVASGTQALWTGLLNELVPQIPGGLNSDVGCFEDRNNVNNPTAVSFHAFGLACDLNSGANPNGANPSTLSGQYVIPAAAARKAAAAWGMEWGGDWTSTPDSMHFEIHLSPSQVAAIATKGKP